MKIWKMHFLPLLTLMEVNLGGDFGLKSLLLRLPLPPIISISISCLMQKKIKFELLSCNLQDQVASVTPIEVVGVVRGSEKPSIFVPANDPGSSQWFYVDVPGIARACGLPENTIYFEDTNENVNPSNPYPVPKDVNTLIRSSVMPRDHLNYTLTWYAT